MITVPGAVNYRFDREPEMEAPYLAQNVLIAFWSA
jgi:hypothetical protein